MKTFFIIIAIFSSIYLMGNIVRQNKSFDSFLNNLEERVKGINDFMRFLLIGESLSFLKKIFGWITVFGVVIYTILSLLNLVDKFVTLYVAIPLLISFYIWFSVSWVIDHKKSVSKYISKEILLFSISPILILMLDHILSTNHFLIIDGFIKKEFFLLNYINLPYSDYRISWAIFYVIISILFIIIWYILTWIFITPVFIIVFLCTIFPIYFARFLNKIFPEIPLVGIAVVLWVTSFLYLTLLNT